MKIAEYLTNSETQISVVERGKGEWPLHRTNAGNCLKCSEMATQYLA